MVGEEGQGLFIIEKGECRLQEHVLRHAAFDTFLPAVGSAIPGR
jgi:hypothetical protein